MIKKVVEIEVKTADGGQKLDQLDSKLKDVEKSAEGVKEETAEVGVQMGALGGKAGAAFTAIKGGISKVVTSFKTLRGAIIATGIGALVIAVLALREAFSRSEEGQNKLAKILGVISGITGKLLDLLSDLGTAIIDTFTNPQKALLSFWNSLKENVVNRLEGLVELIPAIGKSIELVFKGQFSEAAKVAADATGKVVLGVENITDKTQDLIDKTKEYIEVVIEVGRNSALIADKRAKADILERKLLVERAKADREIADLRFKAEQLNTFSVEERIKFIQQAAEIEDAINKKQIQQAALLFEAKKLENAQALSTKEDKLEEAQLQANLISLETARLEALKRLATRLVAFQNEKRAADEADQKARELENEESEALYVEWEARENKKIAKQDADRLDKATKDKKAAKESAAYQATLEKAVASNSIQLASQTAGLLADELGEQSSAGKAAAVAQTTIDTIAGAQATYKSLAGLGPAGPAIAAVGAGLALAAGLSNVKKILAVKTPGSSGSSSVSGISQASIPAVNSPSFNLIGNGTNNQIADALNEQPPVKAYVVSDEITSQQALDRSIESSASI